MPKATSPGPPTAIRVNSTADLLAVLPYLLGFHPVYSLCLVGLTGSRITWLTRHDLPQATDLDSFSDTLTHVLANKPTEAVLLVGYGSDQEVAPAMHAALERLAAEGVMVAEAVRAEHGRYYSYLCDDETCCPTEGTPYAADTSAAAASAVACGLTALPDRGALEETLKPSHGASREAMVEATAQAAEQIEQQMRRPGGPHSFVAEVRDLIRRALELYVNGERLSDADTARLTILLGVLRLRDEAWATIRPDVLNAQLTLWTDMTRRATVNTAACASLLAFAAWLDGNGALARIAVGRALESDAAYSMAHLIDQILVCGIPPCVATLPTPDELERMYDEA